MSKSLKILLVEDSADDAALLIDKLERAGYDLSWKRVHEENGYRANLSSELDLIFSDYTLPGFSQQRALALLRESKLDIPFIVVSGTIGEESAVEVLKSGATDYLLKDRLHRLGPIVERALREMAGRKESKNFEERLRLQAAALENAANAIVITDPKGVFIWVNPAFTVLTGYTFQEVVGKAPDILKSGKDSVEFYQDIWCTINAGHPWSSEFINRRKDGSIYFGEQTITPVNDAHGNLSHFVGIMNDVTGRKEAEEELRIAHETLRLQQDKNQSLLCLSKKLERAETYQDVIKAAREEIEYVIGFKAVWVYLLSEDQKSLRLILADEGAAPRGRESDRMIFEVKGDPMLEQIALGQGMVVVEDARTDPRTNKEIIAKVDNRTLVYVPVLLARRQLGAMGTGSFGDEGVRTLSEMEREYLSAVASHIAAVLDRIGASEASHEADSALRASEERFRQLAENINEVFWITDPVKNQMLYVSPAYESIWGRTCESLYEAPHTWSEAIYYEDRERIAKAASTKQIRGDYNEIYRIQRPDGSVRWIRDRAFPIRDATGEVHRIAGTAEDITEQRRLEEQFRQAQKMEGVGQLAGGVAHDFNNILAAMMMQTELAASCEGVPPDAEEFLLDIKACVERAASLTRQLLAFSRRQVMQTRRLDMNEIVTNLLKMLRRILREDVQLKLELNPTPLLVQADAGMLDQVLLNLVVNAGDAMPGGGRLIIGTTERTIEEAEARTSPGALPGRHICLRVSDTGSGIEPEVIPRIFEPFFTTKEVGKGTGLGLATVFGIVKQHRGLIKVVSRVGEGTTFEILLPADNTVKGEIGQRSAPHAVLTGTEKILIVEDDIVLRVSLRRMLERKGYQVLGAGNGPEALSIWDEQDGQIDLLLTDFVMPGGLNGSELATRLQQQAPTLKVIFTSGYSAELAGQELKLREGQNFLPKPCAPDKLFETIRRCLDS